MTVLEFAAVARNLLGACRAAGVTPVSFGAVTTPVEDPTPTWKRNQVSQNNAGSVRVCIRDRASEDVIADMLDGLLAVNRLRKEHETRPTLLMAALAALPLPEGAR